MILVSGSTRAATALVERGERNLGIILTPGNRNSVGSVVGTGLPWALDNGAFSGFDPEAFRRQLRRCAGQPRLLWVVCPDAVADARATLALFARWRDEVRAAGVPIALVGQDGAEELDLPWDDCACWFIGGSTRWKLSAASAGLAGAARRRGKWVHMGRVNSLRRLRIAADFGCDSVDGSGYSRFAAVARLKGRSDMLLERHLAFVRGLDRQQTEQRLLFAMEEPVP